MFKLYFSRNPPKTKRVVFCLFFSYVKLKTGHALEGQEFVWNLGSCSSDLCVTLKKSLHKCCEWFVLVWGFVFVFFQSTDTSLWSSFLCFPNKCTRQGKCESVFSSYRDVILSVVSKWRWFLICKRIKILLSQN